MDRNFNVILLVFPFWLWFSPTTSGMDEVVCAGFDMRNSPRAFLISYPNDVDKFRHCTVIEGNIHILLMVELKNITKEELEKIRFVNLREITGYLLIFQAKLFKSLGFFFPELRIIRGRELVHDYSLVVLQNERMEELGLSKLTEISRGGVRILFNYQLCFVHTINWSEIIKVKEFLDENKLQNACPEKCTPPPQDLEYCAKRPNSNSTACWTSTECQKICPQKCRQQGLSCSDVNPGQCCHRECVGGCNGTTDADCYACRNVFFQGRCRSSCPLGYYKFYDRRCLTEDECHNKTKKSTLAAGESPYYKASNLSGLCDVTCPTGYEEDSDNPRSCRKCPEDTGCKIICAFDGNIKSMQEVGKYVKRCNVLNGPLEIAIQGVLSAADIKNLENYLSSLHEVRDYVKVSFTPSLVSLNILKHLKLIRGKNLWKGKYALSVFENANLATLWTVNPGKLNNLVIERGQVQMLNNPQLCYQEIKSVLNGITLPHNVTEHDVSPGSNGNRAICEEVRLKFNVSFTPNNIAEFHWERFNTTFMDQRMFLGYRIYFKETTSENASLYENRDMCLDSWTMIFVEPEKNSTAHDRFKPFTLYAFYIQTLTVNLPGARGGISEIVYRRTNFIAPSEVLIEERKITVTSDSISIYWRPPINPNGQITHYKVSYQPKLEQLSYDRDYCSEPPDFKNYPQSGRFVSKTDAHSDNATGFCAAIKCCECKKNVETMKIKEDDHQSKLDFVTMILSYINKPKHPLYGSSSSHEHRKLGRKRRSPHVYASRLEAELHFPFNDSSGSLLPFNSSMKFSPNYRLLYYGNNINSGGPLTINVTGLNYTLRNLTHFTAYEIKIWACQNSTVKHNYCSLAETVRTERTRMIAEKDSLNSSSIRVESVISHGPDKSIIPTQKRVFWDAVDDPNGRIVAYELQYHRQTSTSQTLSRLCVSASAANFNLSHGALLVDLLPGNYSLQIRAVSLAQRGPVTDPVWFFIPETLSLSNTKLTLIILAVCIVTLFGGLFLVGVYNRYQTRKDCAKHFSGVISANPDYMSNIEVYEADEWELKREDIELLKELGCGSFGRVIQGCGQNVQSVCGVVFGECAVKTVHPGAAPYDRYHFLAEATIMKRFRTAHVVKLYGVVSQGLPSLVVMELMSRGNLKEYLMSRRPDHEDILNPTLGPPSLSEVLQMAGEIADGMAYLEAKNFIHRDVAARNCLVSGDGTVKIGDFGLARDLCASEYYRPQGRRMMPVRWMAPEALSDARFTTKSDVWSYGVVLWEITTLGSQPYPGLSNSDVLTFVTEDRRTMDVPKGCPQIVGDLMFICWQYEPYSRPTFQDLVEFLEPYLKSSFKQISYYHTQKGTDLDDPYGLEAKKCNDDKDSGMGFDNNDDNLINDDHDDVKGKTQKDDDEAVAIDKTLGVKYLQSNKCNDEMLPSVKIVTKDGSSGEAKKGWFARFLSFIDPLPDEKELFKMRNAAYEEVMAANALRMEKFHGSIEQENATAGATPLSKWTNFKNSISNRNSSFLSRLPYLKGRTTTNNARKETLEKSRRVLTSDSCHDRGVLLARSQSSNTDR